MSTIPGQDAKDKGNAAFKSGDFIAAIGHYTAAVLADPKNPTYTLNRAAAYLKLGKNEDAERDCDATINLDTRNVKAWFRRGQARAALDKLEGARNDFKKTLVLDPANAAAKQELEKVEALLKYRAESLGKKRTPIEVASPPLRGASAATSAVTNASTSTTALPKRRRVPIKIVDNAASASTSPSTASSSKTSAKPAESSNATPAQPSTSISAATDDFMKPVSTRTLTPSTSSSITPLSAPSTAKQASFKDLKQAREANKASPTTSSALPLKQSAPTSPPTSPPPVRTGGGIFRSNGKHTVFGSPSPQPATPTQSDAVPAMEKTNGQQGPLTLFAFNRAWSTLGSPQEKWRFLMDNVPPASLPSMFKTSLESSQLVSFLETFNFVLRDPEFEYEPDVKATVKAYLINFSRVPRFTTIVLFMSKDEKKLAKDVWDLLDRVDDQIEGGARKVWGMS